VQALQTTVTWQSGVLDPQGPVAAAERIILLDATAIMLAVVLPVILGTIGMAWWFRSTNRRARRRPDWSYSGSIEVVVWSIPTLVILFLGGIAWVGSHDLDPRKALAADAAPLDIQVVSLDWKWLFIYPESGVATVNRLVVPVGVPLRLHLTSASVMNSFFVPQLGSQIYTMAGMTTQLSLLADRPGEYPGLSVQFSGQGFSDMRFDVVAMPTAGFTAWLATTRSGGEALDAARYARLSKPGTDVAASAFGTVARHLFETISSGSPPAAAASSQGHE
jgi:cytochrome o ubiquinol oxidase subunit 2